MELQKYADTITKATAYYHKMVGEKGGIEKDIRSLRYSLTKAQVDIELYQKVQHLLRQKNPLLG